MKKEKSVAVFVDNEERKISPALIAMYEQSVAELEKALAAKHSSVSVWWKYCLKKKRSERRIREEFERKGYWELSSPLGWAWFIQVYIPSSLSAPTEPTSCPRSREWQILEKEIREQRKAGFSNGRDCPFDGYGQLCKESCSSAFPPASCPACRK